LPFGKEKKIWSLPSLAWRSWHMVTHILCSSLSKQSTNLMAVCCMLHSAVNWPK
jgi:hypothetical protein